MGGNVKVSEWPIQCTAASGQTGPRDLCLFGTLAILAAASSSRKHEETPRTAERVSPQRHGNSCSWKTCRWMKVRAEIIGGSRPRFVSTGKRDSIEGSPGVSSSQREARRQPSSNLPVPRQDNGGSCLGGFRGRECLTVLTRERERGVVSAPRRDVDRFVERQISWERMGDDRCTFGILSVRNLTIFEKEKKKRYFLSIWQNENIF